jgi:hypothetical protein
MRNVIFGLMFCMIAVVGCASRTAVSAGSAQVAGSVKTNNEFVLGASAQDGVACLDLGLVTVCVEGRLDRTPEPFFNFVHRTGTTEEVFAD